MTENKLSSYLLLTLSAEKLLMHTHCCFLPQVWECEDPLEHPGLVLCCSKLLPLLKS